MLREATREAATWPKSPTNARPPYVTVNIAGKQLLHPEFVNDVASALRDAGLSSDRLILEITEGTLLDNAEATTTRLQELKALGVRLAIDDFGTGYSSLSYLQRFPIDILKIDKSFVDGVVRGGNQAALARTIISLGDSLALRTVAEGIETDAQRAVLRDLGCQLGQGFLYARPMEPSAIAGAMGTLGLGEEPVPVIEKALELGVRRRVGCLRIAQSRVPVAIEEVQHEADRQPDREADPRRSGSPFMTNMHPAGRPTRPATRTEHGTDVGDWALSPKTNTPIQTSANANSVPMLVRSYVSPASPSEAHATTTTGDDRRHVRCAGYVGESARPPAAASRRAPSQRRCAADRTERPAAPRSSTPQRRTR